MSYKEKMVASYIVSCLGNTPLKEDEVDVLIALTDKDFHSNSKLISAVKEYLRLSDANPTDQEVMQGVRDIVLDIALDGDPVYEKLTEDADTLHKLISLAETVDELQKLEASGRQWLRETKDAYNRFVEARDAVNELSVTHKFYWTDFGEIGVAVTEQCGDSCVSEMLTHKEFDMLRRDYEGRRNISFQEF